MTNITPLLDRWLNVARTRVASSVLAPVAEHVGRIEAVADCIVRVAGLDDVGLDELVRFERGQMGFALALDRDSVGCVLLDDAGSIEAGDQVRGTGEVMRVPVGPALLGRTVDPLGRPLDGGDAIDAERFDPIDRAAPAIIDRAFVSEPVQTGSLVVDSMFALGRGQRELIVGSRGIGKTALAVDCIINQKTSDIVCVYVAIGQKSSTVKRVINAIQTHGAPERCIFVVAGASAATGLQWIAPYAGFTIAEYFRDLGQHALVVIDDLTKHATAHREIALLTRQPPGREAYPGDVFYIHARLLERAAKLSEEAGGGSLTALPIAELDAGNLSAYIPTNLISITDGQIVLDERLFYEGHKPAVDVGTSVSRVGGKAQAPALRKVADSLRLDYAQFLELEMFTRFGSLTDAQVRSKIEHGKRIRACLSQLQYSPLRMVDEVAIVLSLQSGLLDSVPLERIVEFRSGLPAWLDSNARAIVDGISRSRALDDSTADALKSVLAAFAARFVPVARAEAQAVS